MPVRVDGPGDGQQGGVPWWLRSRQGRPTFVVSACETIIEGIFNEPNQLGMVTGIPLGDLVSAQGQRVQFRPEVALELVKQLAEHPRLVTDPEQLKALGELLGQCGGMRDLQSAHGKAAKWSSDTATVMEQMAAEEVGNLLSGLKERAAAQLKTGKVDPELLAVLNGVEAEEKKWTAKAQNTHQAKADGYKQATPELQSLRQELDDLRKENQYWRQLALQRDGAAPAPPVPPGADPKLPTHGKTSTGHRRTPR